MPSFPSLKEKYIVLNSSQQIPNILKNQRAKFTNGYRVVNCFNASWLAPVVTNANSISIELCGTANDGTCRASEKTLRHAADLLVEKDWL